MYASVSYTFTTIATLLARELRFNAELRITLENPSITITMCNTTPQTSLYVGIEG
jgi:hypothetical protein